MILIDVSFEKQPEVTPNRSALQSAGSLIQGSLRGLRFIAA
jgi:hypothetical protein